MSELIDTNALYNIGYGLYVLTTNASKKNGCIVNSVAQITSSPTKIMVCVNKENFSCSEIQKSKVFNLSVLDMTTAFEMIEKFGFSSGKTTDKVNNKTNIIWKIILKKIFH
mgnify:CR=1 FL=1